MLLDTLKSTVLVGYSNVILGGILGLFAFFYNELHAEALLILSILVVFDFVSAIMAVYKDPKQKIESKKVARTGYKLLAYFLIISTLNLVEKGLQVDGIMGGMGLFLDEIAIGAFIVSEAVSILENLSKSGIDIPKKILDKLDKLRK